MVDLLGPILGMFTRLWDCSVPRIAYIRDMQDNLTFLRNEAKKLDSVWLDVKTKVQLAEQQHLKRLNEVKDWLDRVEAVEKEVEAILEKGTQEIQNKCLGCYCPKNFRASYKLGKLVIQKIVEIRDLIECGHFDVVAQRLPRALVDEMPVEKTVGLESTLDVLCTHFKNNSVGIVGLFGMGGVGKTTLLKKFNNEFLPTQMHDVVIWVVVSKEVNLGKIQEVIRKKLNIPDDTWKDETVLGRAAVLYRFLKDKKYVLLLDDLWAYIDLLNLGIPLPNPENGSKVIFTTRLEEVCYQMKVHRCLKVECLTAETAFELFKENVGEHILNSHPDIPRLAHLVAEECKGLPLALRIVGRCMTNKKTADEWNHVMKILRSVPSRISGMVDHVYLLLEFSYENLPSPIHKSCFLFCSLFPEDWDIEKNELIQLWIGESFLAEFDDDIYEARKEGESILKTLKEACLLEDSANAESIKMHDVIRDMALWLACDHGSKTKVFVQDGANDGSVEVSNGEKWKQIERISVWGPSIENISGKTYSPNLVTILVRGTNVRNFPIGVFLSAYAIRTLDLSGNKSLEKLPAGIENLVKLQHLNLSCTYIRKLPVELNKLKNLRCLLVNFINGLTFPRGLISSLSSLQVFSMLDDNLANDKSMLLHELECLKRLQDISIALRPSDVEKLLSSLKLQRCVRVLHFDDLKTVSLNVSFTALRRLKRLEELKFSTCDLIAFGLHKNLKLTVQEYITNLRKLDLSRCEMFDLTWLIFAPSIEMLRLCSCESLEIIINDNSAFANTEGIHWEIFSSLATLRLESLPNLRSICQQTLRFPCLKEIYVNDCPDLMKLPLDSKSATNSLKHIKGATSWWDRLQWEDEATKHLFSSNFFFKTDGLVQSGIS